MFERTPWSIALWAIALLLGARVVSAGEGFWLYDQLPLDRIKERTGVRLTPDWLLNLQQSSARYNGASGGSANFVSADGLLLTNFHVDRPVLRKLTTAGRDLVRDGFLAQTVNEEIKLPGVSLDVLMSVADVTGKVLDAEGQGGDDSARQQARDRAIEQLQHAAAFAPGTAAEVVKLYAGGRYVLYQYNRYTDVRLVFSPESSVVGLPSNAHPMETNYPAPRADFAFIRAYEHDRPAHPPHFLRWSTSGPIAGEPVFISGVPTVTRRHLTVSDLELRRDVEFPLGLNAYSLLENRLATWASRSAENTQAAAELLVRAKYFRVLFEGILDTLRSRAFLAEKRTEEAHILQELRNRSDSAALAAFATVDQENIELTRGFARNHLLPNGDDAGRPPWLTSGAEESWDTMSSADLVGPLYMCGQILLRSHEEDRNPDGNRAPGYNSKERQGLAQWLASLGTINRNVEAVRLRVWLESLLLELGPYDPVTLLALDHQAPANRAVELAQTTHLDNAAFRRDLLNADGKRFDSTSDPLLDLIRALQQQVRRVRGEYETHVAIRESARRRELLALATLRDMPMYPDATRTLRFGYGRVLGYFRDSMMVPAVTSLRTMYDWSDHQYESTPYVLTEPWRRARQRINQSASLNFLTDADVIGGNSGSATVNADGKIVGIVCCGTNLRMDASGDFAYREEARAGYVATPTILEALTQVYGAPALAREISEGHR